MCFIDEQSVANMPKSLPNWAVFADTFLSTITILAVSDSKID